MILRLIAVVVAASLPLATASAQSLADLAGTWIWQVEGKTVFVLELTAGAEGLSGTIERPVEVTLTGVGDGFAVTDVELPVVSHRLAYGGETAEGHMLRYTAPDSDRSDDYLIRLQEQGEAWFALDPHPAAPRITLRRPRPAAEVATDWQEGRTYLPEASATPSNPELAEIYAADQVDRQGGAAGIDWSVVGPRDQARRVRVREMLDEGLIRSGEDYLHAAYVLQHGSAPEDYLLAHALAMAAQAKGRPDGAWIAAASLDRFLTSLDRPQIFGTQFRMMPGEPVSQGEYDRTLIPDSLRSVLGVPVQSQQVGRFEEIEAARADED